MKQLIINQNQVYKVGEITYFTFQIHNKTYRDINVVLEKNDKYILEKIALVCELDYIGLKKKDLVNLIENSNCLVLEQN